MITLENFKTNTASDLKFRERRHPQWTENYELYRDTVITNRLTQRQSVNVPLMNETIKTILANIDDPPDLYFQEPRQRHAAVRWKPRSRTLGLEY